MIDIYKDFIKNKILNKEARNLSYIDYNLDFRSNDYLCFNKNEKIFNKVYLKYQNDKKFGSSGSRLLINNNYLSDLENLISKIKKKESTLIFPSGFQLNSTVIPILIDILRLIIGFELRN